MHLLMLPSFYDDPDQPLCGNFFREQAVALADAGARVGVVYVEPRSLRRLRPGALRESRFQIREYRDNGIQELRLHGWNTFTGSVTGGRVWARLTLWLFDRYRERFGMPDLIHAQNALYAGYAAALIRERYGIPCVVTEHHSAFLKGPLSPARQAIAERAFQGAAAVITVSTALARAVASYLQKQVPLVIPNLVDTDFFTPAPGRPPDSPFTIVAVGRLVPEKRFDLLIEAFAVHAGIFPESRLLIGGDGACRRHLERLAEQSGVGHRITFLGSLDREGVRQLLSTAHLVVVSSDVETFCIVIIEALSMGVPVVATRCGGPEDIITDACGLLVPPDDREELARAMGTMERERARFNVSRVRERAVTFYDRTVVAGQLLALYQEVVS